MEANNTNAILESLIELREIVHKAFWSDGKVRGDVLNALRRSSIALKKPPRNCDVGTEEEQCERYCNFTGRYNPCSYKGNVRCAEDCPIHKKLKREGHGELLCQLEWAQMPYEEGEVD